MPKPIKKVVGWLLAIWGAIRAPVDLLESLKATKHYGEYLYHWYPSFAFVPKSIWFTLGLLIIGIGLISSDRLWEMIDSRWPRVPNIKCHQILRCAITWDQINGCYRRNPDPPRSVHSILLEIANQVERGKRSPPAGRVKAQIIFRFKHRPEELRAAPAAWIDEPCSSVELAPGDTRCLILATGFHFTQDWRLPVNRRSSTTSPISFEHYDVPGLLSSEGTLEVQLVSMDANKILTTFTGGWRWEPQYPLEVTNLVQA
jgi:hypothetical protein